VGQDELSHATATDNSKDAVASSIWPNARRTKRIDFTGEFQSRNIGRRPRRRGVAPAGLHDIGAVRATSFHLHANLIALRRRHGDFPNFEGVRTSLARNDDSFHGGWHSAASFGLEKRDHRSQRDDGPRFQ
jgi:hypothetical protein